MSSKALLQQNPPDLNWRLVVVVVLAVVVVVVVVVLVSTVMNRYSSVKHRQQQAKMC